MNERIRELVDKAISDVDYIRDDDFTNEELSKMYIPDCFAEKFAELIVKELVSSMDAEYCDFWHNIPNNYGCITVKYFVGGNPHDMRGEELKTRYSDGVVRGNGYFRFNENFVQHLMEKHFGVEE